VALLRFEPALLAGGCSAPMVVGPQIEASTHISDPNSLFISVGSKLQVCTYIAGTLC